MQKDLEIRLSHEQFIKMLYEHLLARGPDPQGLAEHLQELKHENASNVLKRFLDSDEFKTRCGNLFSDDRYRLNKSLKMNFSQDTSPVSLDLMWKHASKIWTELGSVEPFWSVLTEDRYRSIGLDNEAAIEYFYKSGRDEVEYLQAFLARSNLSLETFDNAIELGCGVGRISRWLAPYFKSYLALDISKTHLDLAAHMMHENNIYNVECRRLKSRSDVESLSGFDFFFSIIVLQHNPPPIIVNILSHVFRNISVGGVAYFQVPTYKTGYSFASDKYLDTILERSEMEMHYVPQPVIFELAESHSMSILEVRADEKIGNFSTELSNTFLMKKRR